MLDKIHFGYHNGHPIDALHNSVYVLDMVTAFLADANCLQNFDRMGGSDPIAGLGIVINACRDTVDMASNALEENIHSTSEPLGELPNADSVETRLSQIKERLTDDIQSRDNARSLSEALSSPEQDGESYPRLSARDHAIVATVRQGYDLAEVAKAVNLKKATVQNIVNKLCNDGVLDRDETPIAASA